MSVRAGLLASCLGAMLLFSGGAYAAYPGENGKLAFTRDGQVWTMNADGTGAVHLTHAGGAAGEPEWSPDGARIAYTSDGSSVRVMNADGSGDAPVAAGYSPTWFPDGTRIAFARVEGNELRIYDAKVDGSDLQVIHSVDRADGITNLEWSPGGTEIAYGRKEGFAEVVEVKRIGSLPVRRAAPAIPDDERAYGASWSPSANEIAFIFDTFQSPEVARAGSSGNGQALLTSSEVDKYETEWSPDHQKIVYSGQEPGCATGCNPELHVMDRDGANAVQLTQTPSAERHPDWQPVIGSPLPGYPRPRAAPSVLVSLVPAYDRCVAPNRTHGPPLAFDSCNPPQAPFAFPWLTVGTPDANGAPAKMVGWARLRALAGDPATPANEADAGVTLQVSDVRCRPDITEESCTNENAQAGPDYGGDIEMRLHLRITDRYNMPAPAADGPGTGDMTMSFFGACALTADATVGSSCSIGTSANAFTPGAVIEGRRSIMQLSQVEVRSTVTSEVFLRQGVFVP